MMVKNKIGFFSDLDQTLIYSTRSAKLDPITPNFNGLVVVETNAGIPSSFMTLEAVTDLAKISKIGHFIPMTTRTVSQYQRIGFPNSDVEYASTSNGAVILRNGTEDIEWRKSIKSQLDNTIEPIEAVYNFWTTKVQNYTWVQEVRKADNLFIYFKVDRTIMPDSFIDEIQEKAQEWNYEVSVQGKKIYFIPIFFTKALAVKEISERLGVETIICAGDSNLDKGMLQIAKYAIRPAHGSLHEENFHSHNLEVTKHCGVKAGAEIIDKVLARMLD